MLRIALKPSPYLAISLSLGHLGALASVALVPLALWLKLALSIVLLLSLARALRHGAWRMAPSSIVALACDREGAIQFTQRDGQTIDAQVLGSSFVAAYLTIVLLKPIFGGRVRPALVLPDMVAPELFRQLRVWLKWRVGRGVKPEVNAGWAGRV